MHIHTLVAEVPTCSPGAAQRFLSKAPHNIYTFSLLTHSPAPQWNSPREQFQVQCVARGQFDMQPESWIEPATLRLVRSPQHFLSHSCPKNYIQQNKKNSNDVGILLKMCFDLMTANVAADNTVVHCGENWARMNIYAGWWWRGDHWRTNEEASFALRDLKWADLYSCLLTEE